MKKILVFSFLSLLLTFSLSAEMERVYPCYKLIKKPILDGKLDDEAWKYIPESEGFVKLGENTLSDKRTYFKMGYTEEALFVGVKCDEPEIGSIKAKRKDGDVKICQEDSVEIFIFPEHTDNYYQFMINAIGSRWNGIGQGGPKQPLWNWQASTHKGNGYWSLEVMIPFNILSKKPKKGERWRVNVCRNILTTGDRFTTWAYLKINFHEPSNFGYLVFCGKISKKGSRKGGDEAITFLKERIILNLKTVSLLERDLRNYPLLRKEIEEEGIFKNYRNIKNKISQKDLNLKEMKEIYTESIKLRLEADHLLGEVLIREIF